MHNYRAELIKVHDDGSIEFDIELGFGIIYRAKLFKIVGMEDDEFDEFSKKHYESAIKSSRQIVIETIRKSHGDQCWLATIHLGVESLTDWLITAGFIVKKPKV